MSLLPGTQVWVADKVYTLSEVMSCSKLVMSAEDGETITEDIANVRTRADQEPTVDLAAIDQPVWDEAEKIVDELRRLPPPGERKTQDVDEAAARLGITRSHAYRLIKRYAEHGTVMCFMRRKRSDVGKQHLSSVVVDLMDEYIRDQYLTLNRPSIATVHENLAAACDAKGLACPSVKTFEKRIRRIPERERAAKRRGDKYAANKFDPVVGTIPGNDFPLGLVQIDHTPMDVRVVDSVDRMVIHRPWLTIVIDVYSKMLLAFFISLDPPGALATGQCLLRAILPKEEYLKSLGIDDPDYEWPCWGLFRTIHSDNGKDFKGKMLGRAVKEYGMHAVRRPPRNPKFGGHVERSFRTFMAKVHDLLPGTTMSNVQDKGDNKPHESAAMTLRALETWFAYFIVGYYHQKPHAGNGGFPPVHVWKRALMHGTSRFPAKGIPPRVANVQKLRMNFLPFFEATVQRYGVRSWYLTWYSPALSSLINKRNPASIRQSKTFIVRYDPRDLSHVWVYDDERNVHIEVGFADVTRPPVSLFDVLRAIKVAKASKLGIVNEALIFKTITTMARIVKDETEATQRTAKERSLLERRRQHVAKQKENKAERDARKLEDGLPDMTDVGPAAPPTLDDDDDYELPEGFNEA